MVDQSVDELERRRAELFAELAATGDMRRGSVNPTYRRCGKPNCVCAGADHPGHGPRYLLTRSVRGKTRSRQLRAGEVGKVRGEVAAYAEFTALVEQLVEVSEAICEGRPAPPAADDDAAAGPDGPAGEKGGSSGRR